MSTKTKTANTAPHNFTHNGTEVFILRRVPQDRSAHSGFIYPKGVGSEVEAKDFNKHKECGGGLHGWPWGFGLGDGADYDIINDVWLVLGAAPEDVVGELEKGGLKCKCRKATIRFEGSFKDAMDFLREGFKACIKAMATVAVAEGVESSDKNSAQLASSGYYAQLASSGDYAQLASSGYYAKLASSGYYAQLASSGDSAQLASSGDSAKLASSGYYAKLASSGDSAQLASSGYYAQLASSGYYAKLASSGYYAKLASSGYYAQLASSGDYARHDSTGKDSISAIIGKSGKVKTGARGCFALAWWSEKTGWEMAVGKVGRDGIKADTWYQVTDGKIEECS